MNQRGQASNNEDILSSMEYIEQHSTLCTNRRKKLQRLNEILTQYQKWKPKLQKVTSDVALGVLIPHTVLQKLIQKVEKSYGQFSSRVRMLNICR